MPGFSDFGLIFSLGFGFASLPELKIFIVAAACLRMQSLLQYTESGWAKLKQPGPMHFDAPGASITYRLKQSEFKEETTETHLYITCRNAYTSYVQTTAITVSDLHNCQRENNFQSWYNRNNPYKWKSFSLVTHYFQNMLYFQVVGLLAVN